MKTHKKALLGVAALLTAIPLTAQPAQPLDFDRYMGQVRDHNIGYMAEKYNIDIATARTEAAHVFNDPELSVGYSNNQDHTMQMGQSYEAGLSYNFSLGGVRRARIGVARSEQALTEAAVDEYFRNLQADAAAAWADAWRTQQQEQLAASSYEAMARIAQSDSTRLKVGDLNTTDAAQSRLEAQTLYNTWLACRNEAVNARERLRILMGGTTVDSLDAHLIPPDDMAIDIAQLNIYAETNRADLKVAERSRELSERNLKLVQASRAMELGVNAGYTRNTIVRNQIAPAPAFHGVTVGLTIPLKFSAANGGERAAARAAISQSEAACRAVRQQIRSEVIQALNSYTTAQEVARRYNGQMLDEAANVLRNRTYGYLHGESPLIDLLTAQRTYNDTYGNYIEAQSNLFTAYYELRRAIGR